MLTQRFPLILYSERYYRLFHCPSPNSELTVFGAKIITGREAFQNEWESKYERVYVYVYIYVYVYVYVY